MARLFGRTAAIAVLVAIGTAFGVLFAESRKEQVKTALLDSEPVGTGLVEESGDAELVAWWRARLGEAEKTGQWEAAADYAYRLAAYYRNTGREQEAGDWYAASEGHRLKAGAMDVRFYDDVMPAAGEVRLTPYVGVPAEAGRALAKYEPQTGAYLGMFGLFDYPAVEQTFGRFHPLGLHYSGWRKDENDTRNYFPTRMMNSIRSAGAGGGLQVGWEPQYGLEAVADDDYVRSFARQAQESGMPFFFRYASEMNGAWVPWYDDPQTYVEKFRLVSRIVKEEAPDVAMVWSPNFWPQDNIDAYYPGDEYVDWVGFSLYASAYDNGKESFEKNVIDYFAPLYEKYKHKPIMIAEGAIAHYNTVRQSSHAKWAENQLSVLYGYLPRLFPQVKAIVYFNMSKSRSESLKSEFIFDMKENPRMLDRYRRLVQSDYYLNRIEQGAATSDNVRYMPLREAGPVSGKRKLFVYVEMPYDNEPYAVAVSQNGRRIATSFEAPWELSVDFSELASGQPLLFEAFDGKGRLLGSYSQPY